MSRHEPLADQEFWRARLNEAERLYRAASGKAREVARQEYLRVLRIFSDLVIRGKTPSGGGTHS